MACLHTGGSAGAAGGGGRHGVLSLADAHQVAREKLHAAAQRVLVQVVLAGRGGQEHELLDLDREQKRLGAPVVVLRHLREHVVRLVVAEHALDEHNAARAEATEVVATALSPGRVADAVAVAVVGAAAGAVVARGTRGGRHGRRHDRGAVRVHVDWDGAEQVVHRVLAVAAVVAVRVAVAVVHASGPHRERQVVELAHRRLQALERGQRRAATVDHETVAVGRAVVAGT